jgi:two-component system response regulator RegA
VRQLKAIDPSTAIVVLTGYGSIATALESVRLGAVHYLRSRPTRTAFSRPFHGLVSRPRHLTTDPPSLARVVWEHLNRVLTDCDGKCDGGGAATPDASSIVATEAGEVPKVTLSGAV